MTANNAESNLDDQLAELYAELNSQPHDDTDTDALASDMGDGADLSTIDFAAISRLAQDARAQNSKDAHSLGDDDDDEMQDDEHDTELQAQLAALSNELHPSTAANAHAHADESVDEDPLAALQAQVDAEEEQRNNARKHAGLTQSTERAPPAVDPSSKSANDSALPNVDDLQSQLRTLQVKAVDAKRNGRMPGSDGGSDGSESRAETNRKRQTAPSQTGNPTYHCDDSTYHCGESEAS